MCAGAEKNNYCALKDYSFRRNPHTKSCFGFCPPFSLCYSRFLCHAFGGCAMEFLQARFAFDLTEGKVDTFVADVFQPRPDFEDAARFHIWSTDARKKMQHAMQRKNCPVEWAGLVIGQLGLLAIVRFQKRLILGSAKHAASSILQCLPDEQRRAVELGLRPLDEVDKDRISAWQTLADVRPRGFNKRAREEADSEE